MRHRLLENEGLHWISDTQLLNEANRYQGNCDGEKMVTLCMAALNRLGLASDPSIFLPMTALGNAGCEPRRVMTTRHSHQPNGFALPMALVAALVLLLGSLSLQTAGLAERRRTFGAWSLHQAEDLLVSAAQQLVGTIQLHHPCLAGVALTSWAASAGACATFAEQQNLQQLVVFGQSVRLLSWEPVVGADGNPRVDLLLELQPRGAQPARGAAFSVALEGTPPRARDLQLLGLRGVGP